jgi:uncharacterized protein (TIGR02118 family)
MVFLHRRTDLSIDEFRHHLHEVHAPLLRQLPGLQRLVTNSALPDPSGQEPVYDGIGEDWFESIETMQAAFASPAGQAVMADSATFVDMSRLQLMVVEEVEVFSGAAVSV